MRTLKWPSSCKATPSDGRDANFDSSKKRYHEGNKTYRTNEVMAVRRKYMLECQIGEIGETRNKLRREQYCLKLYPPLSMRFVLYDIFFTAHCIK